MSKPTEGILGSIDGGGTQAGQGDASVAKACVLILFTSRLAGAAAAELGDESRSMGLVLNDLSR